MLATIITSSKIGQRVGVTDTLTDARPMASPPPFRSTHEIIDADEGARNAGSSVSEIGAAVDPSRGAEDVSQDTEAVWEGTYVAAMSDSAVTGPPAIGNVAHNSVTVRSRKATGHRLRNGRSDKGGRESESTRVAGAAGVDGDAGACPPLGAAENCVRESAYSAGVLDGDGEGDCDLDSPRMRVVSWEVVTVLDWEVVSDTLGGATDAPRYEAGLRVDDDRCVSAGDAELV